MIHPTLVAVWAVVLLFGAAMFLIIFAEVYNDLRGLLTQGVQSLRTRYVRDVGSELRDSFIFFDPNTLFVLNGLAIGFGFAIGFLLLGPVGGAGGIVLAYLSPRLIINRLRNRRCQAFIYQFPDTLRSMAASMRAGANFTRAMEQIVTNQPPPISQEFGVVMAEARMGRDLQDSLAAMYRRIPRGELELFNSAVNISRAVGGDLADTLDTLANTLQEKAAIEGKIEALTSMGRMQGWVVGLLPIFVGIVIYFQMPEEMSKLVTEPVGWATLGGIAFAMALAAYMIRKIVNIDV